MSREGKIWTSDEKLYLEENWGKISMPAIANNLGRSVNAVVEKARKKSAQKKYAILSRRKY